MRLVVREAAQISWSSRSYLNSPAPMPTENPADPESSLIIDPEAAEEAELPEDVAREEPTTFAEALSLAGARPADSAPPGEKIPYATKLSALYSKVIKNGLLAIDPDTFEGVRGGGEPRVGTTRRSAKKIDVLLAKERQGMLLNISLKTQSFKDFEGGQVKPTKSYCHNLTRIIDQELHVEALRSHALFPRAVLIAVVFFPFDACLDAHESWSDPARRTDGTCSSAAEFAQRLRDMAGRTNVRDVEQEGRFEAAYIALIGNRSDVTSRASGVEAVFFDVCTSLRRFGLPDAAFSFEDWLQDVKRVYSLRHKPEREWID
jgi:hypothetical protein